MHLVRKVARMPPVQTDEDEFAWPAEILLHCMAQPTDGRRLEMQVGEARLRLHNGQVVLAVGEHEHQPLKPGQSLQLAPHVAEAGQFLGHAAGDVHRPGFVAEMMQEMDVIGMPDGMMRPHADVIGAKQRKAVLEQLGHPRHRGDQPIEEMPRRLDVLAKMVTDLFRMGADLPRTLAGNSKADDCRAVAFGRHLALPRLLLFPDLTGRPAAHATHGC